MPAIGGDLNWSTQPNYDAPIACIPTCTEADRPVKYKRTNVQQYNVVRLNQGVGLKQVA